MKKMLAVFLALVLIVSMSVPAFAFDVPNSDTFVVSTSDSIGFDLTRITFNQETQDFLREWMNSSSNVLYAYSPDQLYFSLTFIIAPVTSTVHYSFINNVSYCSFSDNVRVLTLSSDVAYKVEDVSAGSRIFPAGGEVSYFISGSYFANTSSVISDSVRARIDARNYTIKDSYGIFSDWESSFELPPVEYSVSVDYLYDDGSLASPPFLEKYFIGDSYDIPSPVLDGYTPDLAIISGTITDTTELITNYHVVYSETPCKLIVNYLYVDGSTAAPPFIGSYYKGEKYSVSSPRISGYLPDYSVISGTVPASDAADIVFDVVYRVDRSVITSGDFEPLTSGLIASVAVILMVCCSLYAILLSIKCVVELLRSMTR